MRDVEMLGWTAGTFANGAMLASPFGALWVLGLLTAVANRAWGMGTVADLWRRRRSLLPEQP